MNLGQFSTLITLLPHIEAVWKSKGEELPRPDYSEVPETVEGGEESGVDKEGEMDEGGVAVAEESKEIKRNFEATSDEGE